MKEILIKAETHEEQLKREREEREFQRKLKNAEKILRLQVLALCLALPFCLFVLSSVVLSLCVFLFCRVLVVYLYNVLVFFVFTCVFLLYWLVLS